MTTMAEEVPPEHVVNDAMGWLDKMCSDEPPPGKVRASTMSPLGKKKLRSSKSHHNSQLLDSPDGEEAMKNLQLMGLDTGKLDLKRRHSLKPRTRPALPGVNWSEKENSKGRPRGHTTCNLGASSSHPHCHAASVGNSPISPSPLSNSLSEFSLVSK